MKKELTIRNLYAIIYYVNKENIVENKINLKKKLKFSLTYSNQKHYILFILQYLIYLIKNIRKVKVFGMLFKKLKFMKLFLNFVSNKNHIIRNIPP